MNNIKNKIEDKVYNRVYGRACSSVYHTINVMASYRVGRIYDRVTNVIDSVWYKLNE